MKFNSVLLSLSIFAGTLFASFCWANISDGKAHPEIQGDKITYHADSGFHFNKEAPAFLETADGKIKEPPTTKEENELQFDASKVGAQSFTLSFYVCDDKKTVCEEHAETFQRNGKELIAMTDPIASVQTAAKAVESSGQITGGVRPNKDGFIEDNFPGATVQAAQQKKFMLVDFNAPWCPACIRLQTETFGEAEFKLATRKLIKVSLNVDLPQNKALSDKYNVKAIPTLILMDAEGNEIYRILDFKPAPALAQELHSVLKKNPKTYAELKVEAEQGDQKAMHALGLQAFNAMKFADAVKWLAPLKKDTLLFANSEVSYWNEQVDKDPKNKKMYKEVLEKWITILPDTYESIVWRNEIARQILDDKKKASRDTLALLEQNILQIRKFLSSDKSARRLFAITYQGDFSGFEKAELEAQLIDSYKQVGNNTQVELVQKDLMSDLKKMKFSTDKPGQLLAGLHYFKEAGHREIAGEWLEKLLKAYPQTYVYYSKLAHFYSDSKDYSKALPMAQKALQYGPELMLPHLQQLAEIQKNLNQKTEANQTIDRALALPEAKDDRNKKLVAELQEMKKGLSL